MLPSWRDVSEKFRIIGDGVQKEHLMAVTRTGRSRQELRDDEARAQVKQIPKVLTSKITSIVWDISPTSSTVGRVARSLPRLTTNIWSNAHNFQAMVSQPSHGTDKLALGRSLSLVDHTVLHLIQKYQTIGAGQENLVRFLTIRKVDCKCGSGIVHTADGASPWITRYSKILTCAEIWVIKG